jgi:hypothetical protein
MLYRARGVTEAGGRRRWPLEVGAGESSCGRTGGAALRLTGMRIALLLSPIDFGRRIEAGREERPAVSSILDHLGNANHVHTSEARSGNSSVPSLPALRRQVARSWLFPPPAPPPPWGHAGPSDCRHGVAQDRGCIRRDAGRTRLVRDGDGVAVDEVEEWAEPRWASLDCEPAPSRGRASRLLMPAARRRRVLVVPVARHVAPPRGAPRRIAGGAARIPPVQRRRVRRRLARAGQPTPERGAPGGPPAP